MKMFILFFFALSILTSSCSTVKLSTPVEEVSLFGKLNVKTATLKNGLRLLVLEDHSSPTLTYHTWFKVGSMDESSDRTGLAHLFEHMMFKGTKKYPEGKFDQTLNELGAQGMNAATSRDYTFYYQQLPKVSLEKVIELESDRMKNLVINEKSLKTEIDVVHNERRFRIENSPEGKIYQEIFELSFQKHPYHWPVIGYAEHLDATTVEDAKNFYEKYYSPNNATLVIVGDVDFDQTLRMVDRYYGSILPSEIVRPSLEKEPPLQKQIRKTLPLEMDYESILLAYRIPEMSHPDQAGFQILENVLTGGKSSRLYQKLVDTGLCTSVFSYAMPGRDESLFFIGAKLQNKKSSSLVERIILDTLESLKKSTIGPREIRRVRNAALLQFYSTLESKEGIARSIAQQEILTGDFRDGLKLLESIQNYQSDQLKKLTSTYFPKEKRVTLRGVPKKP